MCQCNGYLYLNSNVYNGIQVHIWTKRYLFDKNIYIKYNVVMKNSIIIDDIIATIAVNWTLCLMFCSVLLFRNQIIELVDKGTCIVNYTFKSFACFVSMLMITIGGALFYLGECGGICFANYAINHIYPSIFIMFMDFAAFLLMIFNYFLYSHKAGNHILDIEVPIKSQSSSEYISLFRKPSLALLQ